MKPVRPAMIAAIAALLATAGCSGQSGLERTFGLTPTPPDEFSVTTRAPLSMPPTYALRPPRPGAPRPQETSDTAQAEAALVPQAALGGPPAAMSPGQQALIAAAGPSAPADIRAQVDQEALLDRPSRNFTDKLLFWKSPAEPGTEVNATAEAERLRRNAALGQSEATGNTPVISQSSSGLLDGIF